MHRRACVVADQGPKMIVPENLQPYAARGKPHPCEVCRQRVATKLGFEAGQARPVPPQIGSCILLHSPCRRPAWWLAPCLATASGATP